MTSPILAVMPDPAGRAGIEEVLRNAGYEVRGVSTFAEARRFLVGSRPELLITDVRLGAFNGLHLVAVCTATHPEFPAIVIDSRWDAGLEREAKRLGAMYLFKPVTPANLLALVAKVLTTAGATVGDPALATSGSREVLRRVLVKLPAR